MNTADLVALITGITALIGALSGLVALVVHIVRHDPIPPDNVVESSRKPPPKLPPKTDYTR